MLCVFYCFVQAARREAAFGGIHAPALMALRMLGSCPHTAALLQEAPTLSKGLLGLGAIAGATFLLFNQVGSSTQFC